MFRDWTDEELDHGIKGVLKEQQVHQSEVIRRVRSGEVWAEEFSARGHRLETKMQVLWKLKDLRRELVTLKSRTDQLCESIEASITTGQHPRALLEENARIVTRTKQAEGEIFDNLQASGLVGPEGELRKPVAISFSPGLSGPADIVVQSTEPPRTEAIMNTSAYSAPTLIGSQSTFAKPSIRPYENTSALHDPQSSKAWEHTNHPNFDRPFPQATPSSRSVIPESSRPNVEPFERDGGDFNYLDSIVDDVEDYSRPVIDDNDNDYEDEDMDMILAELDQEPPKQSASRTHQNDYYFHQPFASRTDPPSFDFPMENRN